MKRSDEIRLATLYLLIVASLCALDPRPRATLAGGVAPASAGQLGAPSWLAIAQAVWAKIDKNRVLAVAAGLTFYSLLAIFPAITALVSIYGLFADPASIQQHLASLAGVVPDGAISIIGDQIQRIISQGGSALSFAFVAGLLIALWSANSGVKALFDALNVAYEADETRSFLKLNAITLLFTISAVIFAIFILATIVVVPWALQHLFYGFALTAGLIRWASLGLAIAITGFMLAVVYHFGPAIQKRGWRWVTPGSVFAVVFLLIASAAFAYYTAHFGDYNKTYGTLGAAIGLMTWLWISSIIVMVGAEINAEVERQAIGAPTIASRSQ